MFRFIFYLKLKIKKESHLLNGPRYCSPFSAALQAAGGSHVAAGRCIGAPVISVCSVRPFGYRIMKPVLAVIAFVFVHLLPIL